MIMEIHSKFGVLVCEPMTLQAIEKSISESEYAKDNQFSEVLVGDGPADAVCCEEPGNVTDIEVADPVETDEE